MFKNKKTWWNCKVVTMGWFNADNHIVNQIDLATIEMRIAVGAIVTIVILMIVYLVLRVYNKYQKKGMQNTIRREIQLNNVRSDKV